MANLAEKQTGLSEFFSELSKEKVKAKKELQDKLDNPKSDLSNLFSQLENALSETKKDSEDVENKLEAFSNLFNTLDSAKEIPKEVEVVQEVEPEEIEEPEEVISEIYSKAVDDPVELLTGKTVEKSRNIIQDIVTSLDDMGEKKEVKEEIDQISALRRDFDNFKNLIQRDIANQKMSGAGSGEVRLEFLDDVQDSTAKVDGKVLQYSSSDGKWVGESVLTGAITGLDIDGGTDIGADLADADLIIVDDGAGGTNRKAALSRLKTYIGAGAADDLVAGDAAVTLTTTTGNITIDAAANNSDIIFKGTDGGSDITMLTLDGSAAGAATFNDKIVATELDISGDVDIDGTLEADAITVDGTTLAEFIADTTGAMVSSNTETGITVTYQDGDNTLDFALAAAQTTITSLLATDIKIGEDDQTKIDFETADEIHFYAANAEQVFVSDGVFGPETDSDVDLGTTGVRWKDAYIDTITTTGNVTVGGDFTVSGTTTTVNKVTVNVEDAFIFEGATADAHETTFSVTDPTADRVIVLPDTSGQVQVTPPITLNGTDDSSSNAGDHLVQDTSANANDRILYEDATTDPIAVLASHGITLSGQGWNAFQFDNG